MAALRSRPSIRRQSRISGAWQAQGLFPQRCTGTLQKLSIGTHTWLTHGQFRYKWDCHKREQAQIELKGFSTTGGFHSAPPPPPLLPQKVSWASLAQMLLGHCVSKLWILLLAFAAPISGVSTVKMGCHRLMAWPAIRSFAQGRCWWPGWGVDFQRARSMSRLLRRVAGSFFWFGWGKVSWGCFPSTYHLHRGDFDGESLNLQNEWRGTTMLSSCPFQRLLARGYHHDLPVSVLSLFCSSSLDFGVPC